MIDTPTSESSQAWSLPAEIEARLGEGSFGPQRAIAEAGQLLIILHELREAKQDKREVVLFLIGMRDESNENSRLFELLTGDSRLALDYQIARRAEEQTERVEQMAEARHKLNVLAAFTFPVMALATLLGMNLTHGLEEMTPVLFWTVLVSGGALGFIIKAWVMKGRK